LKADTAEVTRTKIRRRLRKNPLGVRHLIQTNVRVIEQVERTGTLDVKLQQRFENEFLSGEECLAARVLELCNHKPGRSSPKDQAAILELLRQEQAGLEDLLVTVDERQQEIEEAAVLEASIPSMADIEKARRYGSTWDRKFNQAVLQLERAQDRRKEAERSRAKQDAALRAEVARPIIESPEPEKVGLQQVHQDIDTPSSRLGSREDDSPGTGMQEDANGDIRRRVRTNPVGVQQLIDGVDGAINELITTNEISESRLTELALEFPDSDSSLSNRIDELGKHVNGQCVFPRRNLGTVRSLLEREKEQLEALLVSVTGRGKEVEA
jgi:hypothetical protein